MKAAISNLFRFWIFILTPEKSGKYFDNETTSARVYEPNDSRFACNFKIAFWIIFSVLSALAIGGPR